MEDLSEYCKKVYLSITSDRRAKKRKVRLIKGQYMEITDRRAQYQERLNQLINYTVA